MYNYLITPVLVTLFMLSACDRNVVKPELGETDDSAVSSQAVAAQVSSSTILPDAGLSSTVVDLGGATHTSSSSQIVYPGVSIDIKSGSSSSVVQVSSATGSMSSVAVTSSNNQSSVATQVSSNVSSSSVMVSSSVIKALSSSVITPDGVSSSSSSHSSSSMGPEIFVFYADKLGGSDEFTAIGHSFAWDNAPHVLSGDAPQGDSCVIHTIDWGGRAYKLNQKHDFSQFNGGYLHFQIKTASNAKIKLEWGREGKDSLYLREYADLTNEWEKVVIPLDSFKGINLKVLREAFAISYHREFTNGEIALDDIYFSTHGTATYKHRAKNEAMFSIERDTLQLITDNWYGTDSMDSISRPEFLGDIEANYSSNQGERSIGFTINHSIGGGGGYSMSYHTPKDLSYYSGGSLVFDVKTAFPEKAIKLEWGTCGEKCSTWVDLRNYITQGNKWETITIPLNDFSGIDLQRMKVPFGIQNGPSGTVYIKNVRWVK
ncbi:MAG: putative glycoside hydrolase [Fibrobacterales bacterium]